MSAFGSSSDEDEGFADGPGDEGAALVDDELPERVIVVREPIDGGGDGGEPVGGPALDTGPWAHDERHARPGARAAEVAVARPIDLDEVDLRSGEPDRDPDRVDPPPFVELELDLDPGPAPTDGENDEVGTDDRWNGDVAAEPAEAEAEDEDLGPYQGRPGDRRAERDALVAEVAASQVPDALAASLRPRPGRDETGPGTLRPKVPEPVVVARTTPSPSKTRRPVSRTRALLGLVFVVVVAGVGLAGAIGAAVLLVVLVLSRAFGSG